MARRGDIDSLPDRARAGAQAVGKLSGAFEELSRTGRLSAQSIGSLLTALPLLANPATAAAAGVTALVVGLTAYIQKGKELEAIAIERTVGQANAEFQKQKAIMTATIGETGIVADKMGKLAEVQFRLAQMTKADNEAAEQAVETAKKQGLSVEEVYKSYTRVNAATLDRRQALEKERVALEKEIAAERASIASKDLLDKALARINAKYGDVVTASAKMSALVDSGPFSAAFTARMKDQVAQQQAQLEKVQAKIAAYEALGQKVPDALQAEANEIERTIYLLEKKQAVLATLGAMADDALAQTGAGAFNVYTEAMERSIAVSELHSETTGRAMQNVLAGVLRSIGQRAAAEAAMSLGYALFASTPYGAAIVGPPGPYYAAAAVFGGVAASTGVASAALSVNPGGGAMRGGDTRDLGGGKTGNTINVVVIGALDHQSRRDLARQLKDEMHEGDL